MSILLNLNMKDVTVWKKGSGFNSSGFPNWESPVVVKARYVESDTESTDSSGVVIHTKSMAIYTEEIELSEGDNIFFGVSASLAPVQGSRVLKTVITEEFVATDSTCYKGIL